MSVASLKAPSTVFTNEIPSDWDKISDEYQATLKILTTAQRKYRRGMDDAITGVEEAVATISSGDQFAGFLIDYNELIEYLKKANN